MMNRNTILNTILNDNQIALFYLGQEGFLIKHRNLYILYQIVEIVGDIDGYSGPHKKFAPP